MHFYLLKIHNATRWIALFFLITEIVVSYLGWKFKHKFEPKHHRLRILNTTFLHTQALIGIVLFCYSPLAHYFISNFKVAIHQREARFFGLEHPFSMILVLVLTTCGSIYSKKQKEDLLQHKILFWWNFISLMLILISIPWPFSPMVSRPFIR